MCSAWSKARSPHWRSADVQGPLRSHQRLESAAHRRWRIFLSARCRQVRRLHYHQPHGAGFFETAGFSPAAAFVWLAAVLEAVVGVALVLGIFTRYAALAGAFILLTAAYALHSVTGFKGWVWNSGGYEYPVFWAIACLAVALEAFRQRRGSLRAVEPQAAA